MVDALMTRMTEGGTVSNLGVSIAEMMPENDRLSLAVSLSSVQGRGGARLPGDLNLDSESFGSRLCVESIVSEGVVGHDGFPRAKRIGTGPVAESKSNDVWP